MAPTVVSIIPFFTGLTDVLDFVGNARTFDFGACVIGNSETQK